jgi:hypothetical protein
MDKIRAPDYYGAYRSNPEQPTLSAPSAGERSPEMAEPGANRIRIVLRWIQILDNLEPFFKERGEFRFKAKITTNAGAGVHETQFPEEGYYEISDHPSWNKVNLDKVLFEGEVGDKLVVELYGEELHTFSANDHLEPYRREFAGSVASFAGHYEPHDEQSDDPENLSNWRVCYDIVPA